jgi:hypothetical protein
LDSNPTASALAAEPETNRIVVVNSIMTTGNSWTSSGNPPCSSTRGDKSI